MGQWQNSTDRERTKRIVIIGSDQISPQAIKHFADDNIIFCIHDAWKSATHFDYLIYKDDYAAENKPDDVALIKKGINATHYVDSDSRFGGHFWCGFNLGLSAQYWAMSAYKYSQIHMIACDSENLAPASATVPAAGDISAQSMQAKSLRAFYFAFTRETLVYNISATDTSCLASPRVSGKWALHHNFVDYVFWALKKNVADAIRDIGSQARSLEDRAPFDLSRDWSRYMSHPEVWTYARRVDAMWLRLTEFIPAIEAVSREYEAMLADYFQKQG